MFYSTVYIAIEAGNPVNPLHRHGEMTAPEFFHAYPLPQ